MILSQINDHEIANRNQCFGHSYIMAMPMGMERA